MKRRKNAIYTGQTTRVSMGTGGDRVLVDVFYKSLDYMLRDEDEIEIIPNEQVNPTHSPQEQAYIIVDYCVRKILPEITGLFRWGDELTPRLRALAPVVDAGTAYAAGKVAQPVLRAANAIAAADESTAAAVEATQAVHNAWSATHLLYALATRTVFEYAVDAVERGSDCVFYALLTCISVGDEAAYDRIIALTNEMLEAL